MLIKSRKIWLVIWIVAFAVIMYGGFADGWTPLRMVAGAMMGLSVALNIAGLYFNQGLVRHMDRMTEEQLTHFLSKSKPNEQARLRERLAAYRATLAKHVD
jgi:hypothetical protein